MTEYILAIDGGGTKTDVLLATLDGEVAGEGHSGPSNFFAVAESLAAKHVQEAVTQATARMSHPSQLKGAHILMGMAGIDSAQNHQQALTLFRPIFEVYQPASLEIVNDSQTALAGGSTKPDALVLIAGTGSICYGHNQAGETARCSGLGHILSDEGSGYALGMAALRTAVKSLDGRIAHSQLQELVMAHFQVTSLAALNDLAYAPPLTKVQIAELSPLVIKAAEHNDQAAQEIVADALQEWLLMVQAILTKLHFAPRPTDLVLAGSLTGVPLLAEVFAQEIQFQFPFLTVIHPDRPPVYGALELAKVAVADLTKHSH